jgi:hypothetical protein
MASQFTDRAIRDLNSFVLSGGEEENILLVVTGFVKGSIIC